MNIMITGANGHLGLQLMRTLNAQQPETAIVAVVRSQRAAKTISDAGIDADIKVVDYTDSAALETAAAGCQTVIHLVGIIKESKTNTFENAHERPAQALIDARLSATRLITLSIVGSNKDSDNACLSSRGKADEVFLSGSVPATVIRVPMVLGPDDYASMALARNAQKSFCMAFRAESLEQPIYSEDVITAIMAALTIEPKHRVLELAGPESLSRRDLIGRAGRIFGQSPKVISLPVSLGYLLAFLLERLSANPPITSAMLGVLDHDDSVDPSAALTELDMALTPLDDLLGKVLRR